MTLKITNNTTKKQYELTVNNPQFSRLFVTGSVTLETGMDDGEYAYWLVDNDNKILSQGLLQIGDYVQENKVTYESPSSDNEFVQYNG